MRTSEKQKRKREYIEIIVAILMWAIGLYIMVLISSCNEKESIKYIDTEIINGKVSHIEYGTYHKRFNDPDSTLIIYIQNIKQTKKIIIKNDFELFNNLKLNDSILLIVDTYKEIK